MDCKMPDLKKRIYDLLPAPLQNLAVSLVGWRIARRRYGGNFSSILSQYVEREKWSSERVREFRQQRLVEFVKTAAGSVPFYKKRFAELGINPEDIRSEEDFTRLPVLTKREIQLNWDDLHPPGWRKQPLHRLLTSGTTGAGMIIHETLEAHRERWAVIWRYRLRHGLRLGRWSGMVTGHRIAPPGRKRPPYWRVNHPGKTVLYSNHYLSERNLPDYIKDIARRGLTWLHGYPSALTLLAKAMLENALSLPAIRWVTTGAEDFQPHQRESLKRAFGVDATDHYGLGEAVASITQCAAGNMHVDEDFAFTEFLPHPKLEGVFKIIGANFSNPAFPLLRFDTNDLAVLKEDPCECGLPGRVVAEILGRDEDFLISTDGNILKHGGSFFVGILSLREAQVVQKSRKLIEARVVPGKSFSPADEAMIVERIRIAMGDSMEIRLTRVDAIERTEAGKIRPTVSEVKDI